jgi:hypothetical protein
MSRRRDVSALSLPLSLLSLSLSLSLLDLCAVVSLVRHHVAASFSK